jgi:hypothetical protein
VSIIGHFAVGLAAKPIAPKVPLYVLLLSTLLLDFLFFAFALVGIEGMKTDIPWSHGLFMSVIWSAAAALVGALIYSSRRAGVVIGLLVFSHWVLDFISHPMGFGHPQPPDLPLLFHGSPKVGLGLYNSISVFQALAIETGMFIVGAAVYASYVVKKRKAGRSLPA